MKPLRAFAIVVLASLASACATQPAKPALPALVGAPEANQTARATALAAFPGWSMTGRIAVTNGQQGGSGRIEWRQDGARYAATLSAPVTRQGWRVSGGPDGAMLEGMAGTHGTRMEADALKRWPNRRARRVRAWCHEANPVHCAED